VNMNLVKLKGAGISSSEVFVELSIDDLVRESLTWPPKSNQDVHSTMPLPNVIHGAPVSPKLH
jgi:hypothetical protein